MSAQVKFALPHYMMKFTDLLVYLISQMNTFKSTESCLTAKRYVLYSLFIYTAITLGFFCTNKTA